MFHNVYMGDLNRRTTMHNLAWPSRADVRAVEAALNLERCERIAVYPFTTPPRSTSA